MLAYGIYTFAKTTDRLEDIAEGKECEQGTAHPVISRLGKFAPKGTTGLLLWGFLVSVACIGETVIAMEGAMVGVVSAGSGASPLSSALIGGFIFFVFGLATAHLEKYRVGAIGADWELSEDINVFELQRLEPIARWSLSNTLFYIGGITLSLLFTGRFTLDIGNVIINGVLTAAAVVVFFTNMMNTHRIMVEVKNRELQMIGDHLAAASRALRERAEEGTTQRMLVLIDLSLWRAYEQQVEELAEWPYTDEIRRNLLLSLLVPLAAYIVPAVLLEAVRRLLSL